MQERDELVLRLPDLLFEDRLLLGADGSVVLTDLGPGHTESDSILHLPERRLAFVADLIAVDTHPWLGHGDLMRRLRLLDELEELDLRTIVPGHGPVAGPEAIAPMRAYIEAVLEVAADRELIAEVPAPYAGWSGKGLFGRNVAAVQATAA